MYCYETQDNLRAARSDVLNALKIDPINSEALQLADEIAEIEDNIKSSKIEGKITPPPPPPPPTTTDSSRVSESELYKSLGNDAMKRSDYQEALRLYSKSIEIDSNNIVAISNRSQVHIKLCRYIDAEKDASKVIKMSQDSVFVSKFPDIDIKGIKSKALFRRGVARKSIGSLPELEKALEDFSMLIQIDPTNKLATSEKNRTEQLIKEKKKNKSPSNSSSIQFPSNSDRNHDKSKKNEHFDLLSEVKTTRKIKETQILQSPDKINEPSTTNEKLDLTPNSVISPEQKPKSATKRKNNAISITPVLPSELPKNVYELERVWRGLKSHPELFASYLKGFKTSTFKKVFNENVSSDLMSSVFVSTRDHLAGKNPQDAFKILNGLSLMDKFELIVSLLPETDIECIKSIFNIISVSQIVALQNVDSLRMKFKLL